MPEILCRHFNGYKPCVKGETCDSTCVFREEIQHRILIVHLGAIGAVVRSTALLELLREKYSAAHITWVTQRPADQLLRGHPQIDRVLTTERDDLLALSCLEFDHGFCIDKSLTATGVLKATKVKTVYGFRSETSTGSIIPANIEANELWQLGLSNHKKFFENKKPETQLVAEALALKYRRTEYSIVLSDDELRTAVSRRAAWAREKELVIGLNTGCSSVISYKKLTVDAHRELIKQLSVLGARIVLLGGPEDRVRNQQIAYGLNVINSSTENGLRDGLISMQACDIVVSGDSLGMHMAIALKKWVVAWFGPTCAHEIDLYERGVKVLTAANCSPCWKRTCFNQPMCYDLVSLPEIVEGVKRGVQWLMSSSTPRLSVISYSPSHSSDTPNVDFPMNP